MRSLKLASVSALFVVAVSLSAFANSNDCFSNVNLTGVSGTVSGGFTFNSSTDTFSNILLSFNGGLFNGVKGSDPNGGKAQWCSGGWCGFTWHTNVGGDSIWNTVAVNLTNGQYKVSGDIYNWKYQGGDFNYLSVPEGGTTPTYLMLSGFAILAGLLISEKRRRALRTAHSS